MNRKTTMTALVGTLVAGTAVASPILLGKGLLPWEEVPLRTVSGHAVCLSGRAIAGIWVEQVTNVGEFANWAALPDNPSQAFYQATIPADVAYELHVGCGGTPQEWLMSAFSPTTHAASATVQCHDGAGDPAYGTCTLIPDTSNRTASLGLEGLLPTATGASAGSLGISRPLSATRVDGEAISTTRTTSSVRSVASATAERIRSPRRELEPLVCENVTRWDANSGRQRDALT